MYTALLVDDEPSVCKGLKVIVNWNGCGFIVTDTASNGEEAWEKFQQFHYDLIVTDLKMPILDGLGLIRKISSSKHPCQVIIVSAYGEFAYAQEAMQYGVKYYLLKPVDETILEGFLSRIKEKLDAKEDPLAEMPDNEHIENQYRICANGPVPEIKRYINTHYEEPLTVSLLAKLYSFSPAYLGRIFKKETGASLSEYLKKVRLQVACELLEKSNIPINDLAEKVGFQDLNYFYRIFKQEKGVTPNQYRQKNK